MNKTKVTRSDRLRVRSVFVFCIFYLVYRALVLLPLNVSLAIARYSGHLLYLCFPRRRKIVLRNIQTMKTWAQSEGLSTAHIEEGEADLVKTIFIHNAENLIFSIVLMSKPKAVIEKHLRVKNLEVLEKAAQDEKSLLILFAHQGPWELLTLLPQLMPDALSYKKCLGAIYRPLVNPLIDRWVLKIREANGAQLFSREDGFFSITRFLKAKGTLFVASDMRMRQGEPVLLFDKLAASTTIPLKLRKMTGAVPLFFVLKKINRSQWEIDFEEFPTFDVHTPEGEAAFLRCMNAFLERMVVANPSDYFFFQDRYKQPGKS